MTIRHQHGHLRCTERKNGPAVWEFLWRENDATGIPLANAVSFEIIGCLTPGTSSVAHLRENLKAAGNNFLL